MFTFPSHQSVSHRSWNRTHFTEIHGLVTGYESEGVFECMHEVCARCMVGPHSVSGSEVTEVLWTGEVGKGSALPSECKAYICYKCVVTWDETSYGGTPYIIAAHKLLISESGTALIFDFSYDHSLHLVLGIGVHAFGQGITPCARAQ